MRRSTLVLLAVVALLLAFVFLWERKAPSTAEREAHRDDLLKGLKAGALVRLERRGLDPVVLVREAPAKGKEEESKNSWKMVLPLKDAADRYGVEGFADRLATARILRSVAREAPAAGLGLDPPRAVWTLQSEGGETRTVEVGGVAPLDEGIYLRTGGRTVLVPKDLESLLLRPASDFRLKDLLTLGTADVASVTVERGSGGRLSFVRKGEGWEVTEPFEDWASTEKVLALLDDLSLCPVAAFAPSGEAGAGLQSPKARVVLRPRSGAPVTLTLGGPAPGGDPAEKRVYATSSERPGLLIVSSRSLASLEGEAEGFRSLEVFRHSLYDADEIEIQGPRTLRLRRDPQKGWSTEGAAGREDDAVVLLGHLSSLRGSAVLGAPPPPEHPWAFAVKGAGFEERTAVFRAGDGRVLARPLGRPVALVLDGEAWKAAEALLRGEGAPSPAKGGKP
ncbi:MAG: DUF4340 domain-containing protein [Acidobacteriota bacterium]